MVCEAVNFGKLHTLSTVIFQNQGMRFDDKWTELYRFILHDIFYFEIQIYRYGCHINIDELIIYRISLL